MVQRAAGILVVIAAAVTLLFWEQWRERPTVVSGYIEADEIRVGSRVGGRVKEVLTKEGESVAAGAVLVRLEPFDWYQRLAEAQAKHVAAAARHEKLRAGYRAEEIAQATAVRDQAAAAHAEALAGPRKQEIEETRSALKLAAAELELAEIDFKRTESLFGTKAASREAYDQQVARRKVAQATVEARRERLAMLLEGTRKEQVAQAKAKLDAHQAELALRENGFRKEEIDEAAAQLAAAKAAVDAIQQQVAELAVQAPCAAVVEAVELQPGDLIAPSAPVISLMDSRHLWVRAYVPELYLAQVPVGKRLRLRVDGQADRRYTGRVSYVARQGEFTPSNLQTPEERGKQVFRVKIELEDGQDILRPGMAVDVLLDEPAEAAPASAR